MPVCQSLSGKMLLRLHYIFIITNQYIIIIGKYPLRYSMEINLMFPTSEYLELVLMSLSHKSSNMTSCLLKQRRWSLLDMNWIPRAITSGHNNADEFSFPLILYLMRLSSHIVSKVKKMDLSLFHFKKNYWQYLTTSKNPNLIHRIQNLIKTSTFYYKHTISSSFSLIFPISFYALMLFLWTLLFSLCSNYLIMWTPSYLPSQD